MWKIMTVKNILPKGIKHGNKMKGNDMKKLLMCLLFFVTNVALAWQPTKIIEVVVPFPPGSGNDLVIRPLVDVVSRNTNAKFNIVNRAGAGGVVGSTYFVQQPNDGHTINIISAGGVSAMDYTFPIFREKPPYNINSFSYALALATTSVVIIANKNEIINNPEELIKVLTEEKVVVADSGGAGRLGLESILLNIDARKKNPNLIRVEHKGPAETITDVIGGHIRFGAVPLAVAFPHFKSQNIKIIASTQQDDVTALNVSGFSKINNKIHAGLVWGLALPKHTSKEILDWYSLEFSKALRDEKVKNYFESNLFFSPPNNLLTPDGFSKFMFEQEKLHRPVVESIVKSFKQ